MLDWTMNVWMEIRFQEMISFLFYELGINNIPLPAEGKSVNKHYIE